MCGDALDVLPNRIPDSSLDNIFVNHPEPPQQTGREDSEAKHLLNKVIVSLSFNIKNNTYFYTIFSQIVIRNFLKK